MRHAVPLLLALAALAGCGGRSSVNPDAPCCDVGGTGAVTESEFKAMHELSAAKRPILKGSEIDLDGTQAYLVIPPACKPPMPGVVLVHEWWGLNEHIRYWADRLAAEGFAVIAVDLYGGQVATTSDEAMSLMKAVDVAEARETMRRASDRLLNDPRIQAQRRAVMGWCFGGTMALQAAISQPGLDACVIYYGRPVMDPKELGKIQARVLGIYANRDKSIPPETVAEFSKALTKAGVRHEFHRFDAEHAFANPSSARYDEKAAESAWRSARKFLRAHLFPDPVKR